MRGNISAVANIVQHPNYFLCIFPIYSFLLFTLLPITLRRTNACFLFSNYKVLNTSRRSSLVASIIIDSNSN